MQGLDYVCGDAFQANLEHETHKWDKEWMRYFSMGKDYWFYFWDLSGEKDILKYAGKKIGGLDKDAFYNERLYKNIASHVFVDGKDIVDKVVLEMGCGPGIFGRLATRVTEKYIGVDISRFALSIAKLTSQPSATYIHLTEAARLKKLRGTVDTCVGRHFFIHHNYEDCLWILTFPRRNYANRRFLKNT